MLSLTTLLTILEVYLDVDSTNHNHHLFTKGFLWVTVCLTCNQHIGQFCWTFNSLFMKQSGFLDQVEYSRELQVGATWAVSVLSLSSPFYPQAAAVVHVPGNR